MVYIFGSDYPLTIMMPFFLILIMLIFFLTMYIRDNIGKLKLIPKRHKHKEEKKEPTDFHKEYLKLKRQTSFLTTPESLDAITLLTKKYLSEKLNLTGEFSFEELPRNKLDWQTIEFTKRLSDLKYSGKEITKPEIDHLILFLSKILRVRHEEKKIREHLRTFLGLIKFPKIEFKLPKINHPRVVVSEPHKPIKPLDLGLPKKITIDFTKLFKKPKLELHKAPKIEHLKKSIHELKKQAIDHIKKTEHRKVKSKLYKFLKALCKEEHRIYSLEERSVNILLKKAGSLSKLISKKEVEEGYETIRAIRDLFSHLGVEHKLPYISKPITKPKEPAREIQEPEEKPKIKPHKIHKQSIFERIRINSQVHRVLRLIGRAERTRNSLISRRYYNEALIMYYKLPIEKEENIAIRLNDYYRRVEGKHEKELLEIKHTNRKATREALKHLKKYRNYIVIEQNHFNNQLRRSLHEVKKQAIYHINKAKHKKVKSKLSKFLKAISKEENGVFALEEGAINKLLNKASLLIKTISREESQEAYNTQRAIRNLFSHLKLHHKLPKTRGYIEIKVKELPEIEKQLPEGILKPEMIKEEIQIIGKPKEIKIRPPEVKIRKKPEIKIEPPRLPERRISDRMRKLLEEKESIYNKLREVEGEELDRFKQTKRISTHENINYRDFLSSVKPKSELPEEHRIKKLFEAK
jgi:hypothetical protein